MRRIVSVLAVMALCLSLAAPALAGVQYPPSQGIVTDLSADPTQDHTGKALQGDTVVYLEELSEKMKKESLGSIYVAVQDFIGGQDARDYANALFDAWELGSGDVLLLMVIGEETAALAVGEDAQKALPRQEQTNLLANHFQTAYKGFQYDRAVKELSVQVADTLAKANGKTVSFSGLNSAASTVQTPSAPSTNQGFHWTFSSQSDEEENVSSRRSSFNWKGWLIWGVVIYLLFFRRRRKKYNFGHGPNQRK
jgi:uncharacterized membrane protein YgcG